MKYFWMSLILTGCALVGCDQLRTDDPAELEKKNSTYLAALAAEQADDCDKAIALYQELTLEKPRFASAHLNLARLFHDKKKNYIDAVYHYQAFLILDPDSEKKTIVTSRLNMAKNLLASQYSAQAASMTAEQVANSKQLLEQVESEQAANRALKQQVEILTGEKAELERQVQELRKLLTYLRERDTKTASALTDEEIKSEIEAMRSFSKTATERPKEAKPTDEISDIRNQVEQMLHDPSGGVTTSETKTNITAAVVAPTPKTKPQQTYTIKPGDSLYKISTHFYGRNGDWRKIRDANRAVIPDINKLAPGTVIVIP